MMDTNANTDAGMTPLTMEEKQQAMATALVNLLRFTDGWLHKFPPGSPGKTYWKGVDHGATMAAEVFAQIFEGKLTYMEGGSPAISETGTKVHITTPANPTEFGGN